MAAQDRKIGTAKRSLEPGTAGINEAPPIYLRALWNGAVAGGLMAVFELVKMAFNPGVQLWISHLITVVFTVLIVTAVTIWMLLKQQVSHQAITATEERYRLLFERSLAGAYRTSLDGQVLDCNVACCQMLGYATRQEAIGQSVAQWYVNPQDRERFLALLRAEKQVTNFEQQLRRADGEIISAFDSAALVEGTDGSELFVRGTLTEITELRRAEQEQQRLSEVAKKSEAQYRILFERNPIPMWVFERTTLRFLAVNQAAVSKYGYSEQEFLSMTIADIRPEQEVPRLLRHIAERQHGLQSPEQWQHRVKNGSMINVEIISHDLDFDGSDAVLVASHDVTERKRAKQMLEESENRYRVLFEDSPDAYLLMDQDRFVDCNAASLELFGFSSKAEFTDPVSISPPIQPDGTPSRIATERRIAAAIRNGRNRFEWMHRRQNGETFFADVSLTSLNLNGREMLLASVRDISARKSAEARAQYLAYYDALTGLPNRVLFEDRLEVALAVAGSRREEVAVLFLDIDRFTIVNDSLGRSFGDEILKEVALRLKRRLRDRDTVARIGSDEFAILLNAVHDSSEAGITASRLIESMAQPFEVENQMVAANCSIGISMFPQHGADAASLLKNSEAAMRRAKDDGRSTFRFFSEDISGKAAQELAMEHALRTALPRNEFFLVYQPQIELATGKITGMEALIRWRHPDFGLVPPDRFIHIAEENGLILSIGEWVLRTACAQLRQWQIEGLPVVPVAVNVSPTQFRTENFCAQVGEVLRETGVSPDLLELELTESVLFANADRMNSILREFNGMGVKLAIDDFGTGYSNLSYLKQFRANKIKIDRSFVQDLPADTDNVAITTAIISMAKSLDLTVIAEGVETEEQLSFLRECQCDEIQGYYFSKPVTADEMKLKLGTLLMGCSVACSHPVNDPQATDQAGFAESQNPACQAWDGSLLEDSCSCRPLGLNEGRSAKPISGLPQPACSQGLECPVSREFISH